MRKILTLLLGSFLLSCKTMTPLSNTKPLFIQDELKLVGSDFSFTEGCSVDKDGNVFFTDQPNDKIWKYSVDGKLSLFLGKSGRSNGTYFDGDGNLLTCADEEGEIWSISPSGKVNVVFKNFEGKQLNGPNDLWIDASGGIYFTDPYYQRPYWDRSMPDLSGQNVYYLPKGSQTAEIVANDLNQPNGIVGTPDGKYLYVADIGAGKIYRYRTSSTGVLHDKYLLIERGADGMTLDHLGNIYLTGGNGVFIYDKEGKAIGSIAVPQSTSNVCFYGKDKNILFITARTAVYTIPMTVKGVE